MSDDTFFGDPDADKTVISPAGNKPMSGGSYHSGAGASGGGGPKGNGVAGAAIEVDSGIPASYFSAAADTNPVIGCAQTLLSYAVSLRMQKQAVIDATLYRAFVKRINDCVDELRSSGVNDRELITFRYMLCTFIDEMVLNTPSGAKSAWAQQPLLVYFHKEAQGGVRFFQILQKLESEPATYYHLLQFAYICLSMGMLGQYRVQPDGQGKVQQIRDNLFRLMSQIKPPDVSPLSPRPELLVQEAPIFSQQKFIWLLAALCCTALVTLLTWFNQSLSEASSPLVQRTALLGLDLPELVRKERKAVDLQAPREISDLLKEDIRTGRIELVNDAEGLRVILYGKNLFRSGEAAVLDASLVQRVARATGSLGNKILISGHSDNIPIQTLQFPSNRHLSQARADAVAAIITKTMPATLRVKVEGMADLQPVAPNDTPLNREKNRRVEVKIFTR
jgi:type VI secretion system protein ImpK